MSKINDSVKYRNQGDDYHILWTGRRALRLLDSREGAPVAVVIENVSPNELGKETPETAGLLVVDTVEYYGSENLKKSGRAVYSQLKHSTTQKDKCWTAGDPEVQKTIAGFGKRFKKLCSSLGKKRVVEQVQFHLVTNRPIAESFSDALKAAQNATEPTGHAKAASRTLKTASTLSKAQFLVFAKTLHLNGRQGALEDVSSDTYRELNRVAPASGNGEQALLEQLVRRKAAEIGNKAGRILTKDILEHVFRLDGPEKLRPAPAEFNTPNKFCPREQENEIAKEIIKSDRPVVISATGGVGKSILSQRLPDLMPQGSVSVVFDGFANGGWRNHRAPRHTHNRGLVQIVNEIAFRGLCLPLVPTSHAEPADYLNAFFDRCAEAASELRRTAPDALLVIVVDAADHVEMAGEEAGNEAFAKDLLRLDPPPGCRIVALARPERLGRLELRPDITPYPLAPFTEEESAWHMRTVCPEADDAAVAEFHRLTSANPRIQANELSLGGCAEEVLDRLGPTPLKVEIVIERQIELTVCKVKENWSKGDKLEQIFLGLAVLPVPIPVHVLAQVSGADQTAIESFVADLAHERNFLLIVNGGVQFRDEPVEDWFRKTWFKKHFKRETTGYRSIAASLANIAVDDGYAAAALPRILLRAERYSELVKLALSDEGLPDDDHVARRTIVLERARFAFQAALKLKRYADVTKLALRTAEETAGQARRENLVIANLDLISAISGFDEANGLIENFSFDGWIGTGYAYRAAAYATRPLYSNDAKSALNHAEGWLAHWSSKSPEERQDESVGDHDISAMIWSYLFLYGAERAVAELERWSPPTISFRIGSIIASRLVDAGEWVLLEQFFQAAEKNLYLSLAIVHESMAVGYALSAKPLRRNIKQILKESFDPTDLTSDQHAHGAQSVFIDLAEAAAMRGIGRSLITKLLTKYSPQIPEYGFSSSHDSHRHNILRAYALKAELNQRSLDVMDVAPQKIREQDKLPTARHNRDEQDHRQVIGALLPWYRTRASCLVQKNLTSKQVTELIENTRNDSKGTSQHSRRGSEFIVNEIFHAWIDALVFAQATKPSDVLQVETWADNEKAFIYIPRYTQTIRSLARCAKPPAENIERFAAKIVELIESEHSEASSSVESYTELSRALLALSPEDASVFFDDAMDAASRLGDEMWSRWASLASLALATKGAKANPERAYRLSRVAEMIGNGMGADHFPWDEAAQAITVLSPSSGLAIVSRWRDRDTGWLGKQLPSCILELLSQKKITAATAYSFAYFKADWDEREILQKLLEHERNVSRRRSIVQEMYGALKIRIPSSATPHWFADTAAKFNALIPELRNLPSKSADGCKTEKNENSLRSWEAPKRPQPKVRWSRIIGNRNFLSRHEIEVAEKEITGMSPYWPFVELLKRMREQVPRGSEIKHLEAFVEAAGIGFTHVLSAFEEAHSDWKRRPIFQKNIKGLVLKLIRKRQGDILTSPTGLGYQAERLRETFDLNEQEIVDACLAGMNNSVETVHAEGLFVIALKLAERLKPSDAMDVLDFGLARFEKILKPDDSDGPWTDDLNPPQNVDESVAGFLWACLGAPDPELRWQAAHSVRRLCRLDQKPIIRALINRIDDLDCPAFVDAELPFYSLHARLYLLIALARAARECPSILQPYKAVFRRHALEELPHVLIRSFSAAAAINLEEAKPRTFTKKDINKLKKVNASTRAPDDDVSYPPKQGIHSAKKDADFFLPFDMKEYWLTDLPRIFVGSDINIAMERMKQWLTEWNALDSARWSLDPRAQRGMYRSMEAHSSHGSYPNVDDLGFYSAWHALFCTAGEFLKEYPVKYDDWDGNTFDKWILDHSLTNKDGTWLADRRDARPSILSRIPSSSSSDSWQWEVASSDFDEVLGVSEQHVSEIPVWGSWSDGSKYQNQNFSVHSALVPTGKGTSLLRSLQTRTDLSSVYIPSHGDEHHLNWNNRQKISGFHIKGWISDVSMSRALDQFDPFSGGIDFPPLKPMPVVERLFRVRPNTDCRYWFQDGSNNLPVFSSVTWGEYDKQDKYSKYGSGRLLTANVAFLRMMLERLNRDLIIEVSIRRNTETRKEEGLDYVTESKKIYLLQGNGTLDTLWKRRRIGEDVSRGTWRRKRL